ncbi:MAG: response regulator, partial [Desulfamplus sp.]|nr:response regulator [Desulfamplus sp.]
RIHQIVLNLISNAVKFTEKGEISVSVSCSEHKYVNRSDHQYENGSQHKYGSSSDHQYESGSEHQYESSSDHQYENRSDYKDENEEHGQEQEILEIIIVVKDTGIGIPENKLNTIFENFTQADDTITRKYGGTGLGLAISKRLAEMMNGNIVVQSILGEGSSFALHLPLPVADKDGILYEKRAEQFEAEGSSGKIILPSCNGTALIVEDNLINMLVIRTYLSKMGFNIIEAANGKEAVKKYTENDIDLIFMDIHMPIMNGLEATKKIREYETGKKRTPIIALTADAFKDDKDLCIAEGMDFHLAKPFTPEEIVRAIHLLIPDKLKSGAQNKLKSETQSAESDTQIVESETQSVELDNAKLISKPAESQKDMLAEMDNSHFPVFDRRNFLGRIENNMEVYDYVISRFLETVPEILSKLYAVIEKEEFKDITFHAHALKGTSLTIGACRLSDIAKQIEQTARNSMSIEDIRTFYAMIEPAFKEFCIEEEKHRS